MLHYTLEINENTSATLQTEEIVEIGDSVTATVTDENGNIDEITGIVTDILETENYGLGCEHCDKTEYHSDTNIKAYENTDVGATFLCKDCAKKADFIIKN